MIRKSVSVFVICYSEYAGDKIVILSTHIVSDIEAIADEVLLMKKGKFVLQGTVPELIHKANGKVWEISASPQELDNGQTKTRLANFTARRKRNYIAYYFRQYA